MRFPYIVLAAVLLLGSCLDPKKASDSNFKKAIQAKLDKESVCITAMAPEKLADVGGKHSSTPMIDSLVALGMIAGHPITIIDKDFGFTSSRPGMEYVITEKGKQFERADKNAGMSLGGGSYTSLCSGKKEVVDIVRYSEPSAMMGQTISQVTYTYKITDLASWMRDPAFLKAYPVDLRAADAPVEAKMGLILMSDGWRVPDSLF